jgi:hypothetical protein
MAEEKMKTSPRYTWGDEVRVISAADKRFRPGQYGVVCAITEPDADEENYKYTVEYDDGSSCLIPEDLLEPEGSRRGQQLS